MAASTDAERRASQLACWSGLVNPEPMGGGFTNTNRLVRDGGERYFLLVGVDMPVHGILRCNETADVAPEPGEGSQTAVQGTRSTGSFKSEKATSISGIPMMAPMIVAVNRPPTTAAAAPTNTKDHLIWVSQYSTTDCMTHLVGTRLHSLQAAWRRSEPVCVAQMTIAVRSEEQPW